MLNAETSILFMFYSRTTDTWWRHKSKISEKLGQCGRQYMLRPYLKIWDWDWIFGHAVKAISSLGVRGPCHWAFPVGNHFIVTAEVALTQSKEHNHSICYLLFKDRTAQVMPGMLILLWNLNYRQTDNNNKNYGLMRLTKVARSKK